VIPTLYYQFAGKRGPASIDPQSEDAVELDSSSQPEPAPMAK
jgi:hypothetical protein